MIKPIKSLKRAKRRVVGAYRNATVNARALPDFLIIGAQKCGTTSLFSALERHSMLKGSVGAKELHFFDDRYGRGLAWYQAQFPVRKPGMLYYEATPYYMYHPLAAERAARHFPRAKLIAILRDPVARAFSHYQHQKAAGRETLSFEAALEREPERLAGEEKRLIDEPGYSSFAHRKFSYTERGQYARQLQRWLQFFPREQLLVLSSEAFRKEPQKTLDTVFDFLGVPRETIPLPRRRNRGRYNEQLSSATRRRLAEYFAPCNRELYRLLGRDLGW